MGRRRKAREIVLQALYEAEFAGDAQERVIERQIDRREPNPETAEYARQLFTRVLSHRDELDGMIESGLDNWEMDRVALVDKNILRFALAEVLYFPDVPSRVIINEAIEIAHRYSSADAGRFVNGLLDRFIRQHRKGVV
jgi:N utilization substance protein B